jgi:hypothetical protein
MVTFRMCQSAHHVPRPGAGSRTVAVQATVQSPECVSYGLNVKSTCSEVTQTRRRIIEIFPLARRGLSAAARSCSKGASAAAQGGKCGNFPLKVANLTSGYHPLIAMYIVY